MSFADQRKTNFYGPMLAHFGERVSVRMPGQTAREISALCRSTSRDTRNSVVAKNTERLRVTVGKDEAHELGGIALPKHGLQLRRAGQAEDIASFVFVGEIEEETLHSYTLIFERPLPHTAGRR